MKSLTKKRTSIEAFFLILKGIAMGAANKVPGVSGGIVALVGGFYEELIFSFQRLNLNAFRLLITGRFRSFWNYVNGAFLTTLFGGVIISYFSVSLLLDYALNKNESIVMGAFLGMILASLVLVIKQVDHWERSTISILILGLVLGLSLSFARPISENDQLYFVFFCGIISVSGMTIPGLSGSFLLLILGNYNLLLVDAVNALFKVLYNLLIGNFELFNDPILQRLLIIMAVFGLGSILGLILFSNMIKWVLKAYPKYTLAAIIGFITGTLRLVWPWKLKVFNYDDQGQIITNSVGNPKVINYRYDFPDFSNLETYAVIIALIFGATLLFAIDNYDKKKNNEAIRPGR